MSVLVDARPPSLGAKFRPGNTFDLTLTWPADVLDGRTFTATLDDATLTVSVVADTMTVSATAAQTTAAGVGAHEFVLSETTGGLDQAVMVGRWVGSTQGATSQSTSVEVVTGGATVTVQVVSPRAPSHITVPAGWGERWEAAVAEVDTRAVTVAVIGDSISIGGGATDYLTDGYVGLLRAELQERYGDAGDGFVTVGYGQSDLNALIPGWSLPVTGGGWTADSTLGGPNGSAIRPTTAGDGSTITFTVDAASELTIWSATDPTYGRYDYELDGAAAVQVPQNLTAGVQATTIPVADGEHTVKITAASGTCRIYGVQGDLRSSGIVVQNMSMFGRETSHLPDVTTVGTTESALRTTVDVFSGDNSPADLGIFALGINDMDSDVSEADVVGWVDAALRLLRGYKLDPDLNAFGDVLSEADTPADLIVVLEHRAARGYELVDLQPDVNVRWTRILSALRSVAATYGAAVVDMWGIGGRSYTEWNDAGMLYDPIGHPSDDGHAAYADPIIDLLT